MQAPVQPHSEQGYQENPWHGATLHHAQVQWSCSNTDLRIIPSLNWLIIKASFTATNCSLKWHISSDNKPFLAGHPQTQLKTFLWVQTWLLTTSGGQLSSVCNQQCTDLLQFLWAPNFSGVKLYLFQMQKLLHMTTPCPHSPTIHKHYKNETLWSFCWGNIRT